MKHEAACLTRFNTQVFGDQHEAFIATEPGFLGGGNGKGVGDGGGCSGAAGGGGHVGSVLVVVKQGIPQHRLTWHS